MSISTVSSAPPVIQANPQQADLRAAFSQLTTAIDSGDLQGAQTAYAALTDLQQSSGTTGGQSPFGKALASIGSALNSGDVSGAQSALQAFQKAHAGHHHHHKVAATGSTGQDNSTTASPGGASQGATGSLDIRA